MPDDSTNTVIQIGSGAIRAGIRCQIIEVTRRCNMSCPHCLRGPAQDLDIRHDMIYRLFREVSRIDTLTFTGGEPSLAAGAMAAALLAAQACHVDVRSVYVVTNGKELPQAFLDALHEWHRYCILCEYGGRPTEKAGGDEAARILRYVLEDDVPAGVTVALSLDEYHEPIPVANICRLACLPRLTLDKHVKEGETGWLIPEGNAKGNGLPCRKPPYPADYGLCVDQYGDGTAEIDELFLSAKGKLLAGCDWSYASQEGRAIADIMEDGWLEKLLESADNG